MKRPFLQVFGIILCRFLVVGCAVLAPAKHKEAKAHKASKEEWKAKALKSLEA